MMYGWDGTSWVWGVTMMLVMIGVIALVLWAIVRTVGERPKDHGADASQVLAQRFARGEIDQEEFEERRRILLRT